MRKKEVCERLARWFAEMEGRKRVRERRKRKKRRLFTVYRCRLRVTAKKPARRVLGKAVKPWPDNVKRFQACKVGTFSFSLLVEKLPLSVSFVGKINRRDYERPRRVRGAENENWKERTRSGGEKDWRRARWSPANYSVVAF